MEGRGVNKSGNDMKDTNKKRVNKIYKKKTFLTFFIAPIFEMSMSNPDSREATAPPGVERE